MFIYASVPNPNKPTTALFSRLQFVLNDLLVHTLTDCAIAHSNNPMISEIIREHVSTNEVYLLLPIVFISLIRISKTLQTRDKKILAKKVPNTKTIKNILASIKVITYSYISNYWIPTDRNIIDKWMLRDLYVFQGL